MGHHYAIWASDSNILLAPKKNFGPIKIHSFTSLTGVGALQGNFGTGTGVQLKLRKHPNEYIAIK
jgi:hypothetical protein